MIGKQLLRVRHVHVARDGVRRVVGRRPQRRDGAIVHYREDRNVRELATLSTAGARVSESVCVLVCE